MGTLSNTLTTKQLEWLNENVETWYGVPNTTITKYSTWTYVLVITLIPGSEIANISQLNNDGTTQGNSQRNVKGTDYWSRVYDGTEETGMYYYYINHDGKNIDSVETIDIPFFPANRVKEPVKVIADTGWTWLNMYKVLNNLVPDILAIPYSASARQNLAYEWDSVMALRYFSPYMMSWVAGKLSEEQIAIYLKSFFGDKWNRMFSILSEEYDALQPYSIHEEEHKDEVKDEDKTTSSESTSDNSGSNSESTDTDETGKRYGFNSTNAVNVDKQIGDNSSSGSYSDDLHNVSSGSTEYTTDNDYDRELDRTGNIGNITMQQLVDQEWETRKKLILETIRVDITDTLTLPYYRNCI